MTDPVLLIARINRSDYQFLLHTVYAEGEYLSVEAIYDWRNIAWQLEESVTNEPLGAILFPNRHTAENLYLEPDFAYIHAELPSPR